MSTRPWTETVSDLVEIVEGVYVSRKILDSLPADGFVQIWWSDEHKLYFNKLTNEAYEDRDGNIYKIVEGKMTRREVI